LNQAGFPGGIKSADLVENKELGITISAVLPYSATVAEENNRRRLVAQTKPRDIFSLALSGIVELLLDDPREEVTKNAG
jgi:hypothetical protein